MSILYSTQTYIAPTCKIETIQHSRPIMQSGNLAKVKEGNSGDDWTD